MGVLYDLDIINLKTYERQWRDGVLAGKSIIIDTQKYIVFKIPEKPYVAIAWPTIDGGFTALPEYGGVLLEYDRRLAKIISNKLNDDTVTVILFPRYDI